MRRVLPFVLATLLTPFAVVPVVAAPPPCPASWELADLETVAVEFFPHLLPGQFETAAEFEAVLAEAEDPDADGVVCVKEMWGFDLNPKSHWYRLGFDVGLNEPVHVILVKNDRP